MYLLVSYHHIINESLVTLSVHFHTTLSLSLPLLSDYTDPLTKIPTTAAAAAVHSERQQSVHVELYLAPRDWYCVAATAALNSHNNMGRIEFIDEFLVLISSSRSRVNMTPQMKYMLFWLPSAAAAAYKYQWDLVGSFLCVVVSHLDSHFLFSAGPHPLKCGQNARVKQGSNDRSLEKINYYQSTSGRYGYYKCKWRSLCLWWVIIVVSI